MLFAIISYDFLYCMCAKSREMLMTAQKAKHLKTRMTLHVVHTYTLQPLKMYKTGLQA